MGIVVCISMLIGVVGLLRKHSKTGHDKGLFKIIYTLAPGLSILMGLWNVAWYGLRHLSSFWGHAALATGVVMLLAGIILLFEAGDSKAQQSRLLIRVYTRLRPLRSIIFTALLAGFLLYAITLIQLNLDYPIIR